MSSVRIFCHFKTSPEIIRLATVRPGQPRHSSAISRQNFKDRRAAALTAWRQLRAA
jgi:hypothetical protein